MTKQKIIETLLDYSFAFKTTIDDIRRDDFVQTTDVSKFAIGKHFSTFTALKENAKSYFDKNSDNYIDVPDKGIKVSKEILQKIQGLYAGSSKYTAKDVAIYCNIPESYVIDITKGFGITHKSAFSDYDAKRFAGMSNEDKVVEETFERSKLKFQHSYSKKEQREYKRAFEKLNEYEYEGRIVADKFGDEIANKLASNLKLSPEIVKKPTVQLSDLDNKDDSWFVIVLSDLHYGSESISRNTPDTKCWSIQHTINAMIEYEHYLMGKIRELKLLGKSPKKLAIIMLGDIIHADVNGKTDRGTLVGTQHNSMSGASRVIESISSFIRSFVSLENFETIYFDAVEGNHNSQGDLLIMKSLAVYLKCIGELYPKKHVVVNQYLGGEVSSFNLNDTPYIIKHGSHIPAKKGNDVQYMMKTAEEDISSFNPSNQPIIYKCRSMNIKPVYLKGDLHSFIHTTIHNYTGWTFIQSPALVGGDTYAEQLNYSVEASQIAFTTTQLGEPDVIHQFNLKNANKYEF